MTKTATIETSKGTIVAAILERFRPDMQPANRELNLLSGEELVTAALGRLDAARLAEASRMGSYAELRAFLQPAWQQASPGFMALSQGGPITPNLIGDAGRDLVFTPLTPCRIIDTRVASDPVLLGAIGPDAGKHFQVPCYQLLGGKVMVNGMPVACRNLTIRLRENGTWTYDLESWARQAK